MSVRWLWRRVKFLIALLLVGIIAYACFVFYFTWINPVAIEVRQNVLHRASLRRIHFVQDNEIPAGFRNAMIATEDRSFAKNIGIDPIGIIRSVFVDVTTENYAQGGSTITQQLIRNAYLDASEKTMKRKISEAFYSIGLTRTMSKADIFTLYVNDINYGEGAYGLYDAAETYFGRPPQELNDGELALLAGLPNAPSAYDPFVAQKLALERQRDVVQNMVEDGMITDVRRVEILAMPLRLKQKK